MLVSENPEVISEERAQYLLKKWGPILRQMMTTKECDEAKLSTSIIIESQESWISPEAKKKNYELGNKIH